MFWYSCFNVFVLILLCCNWTFCKPFASKFNSPPRPVKAQSITQINKQTMKLNIFWIFWGSYAHTFWSHIMRTWKLGMMSPSVRFMGLEFKGWSENYMRKKSQENGLVFPVSLDERQNAVWHPPHLSDPYFIWILTQISYTIHAPLTYHFHKRKKPTHIPLNLDMNLPQYIKW